MYSETFNFQGTEVQLTNFDDTACLSIHVEIKGQGAFDYDVNTRLFSVNGNRHTHDTRPKGSAEFLGVLMSHLEAFARIQLDLAIARDELRKPAILLHYDTQTNRPSYLMAQIAQEGQRTTWLRVKPLPETMIAGEPAYEFSVHVSPYLGQPCDEKPLWRRRTNRAHLQNVKTLLSELRKGSSQTRTTPPTVDH